MDENNWFFATFDRDVPTTYEMVKAGNSVYWPDLEEEGRYAIWSLHIESNGPYMNYVEFCNVLDNMTKEA